MKRDPTNPTRGPNVQEAIDNDPHTEMYLCAPLSIIVDEGRYRSQHDLTIEQTIDELDEMDLKDDDEI